MLPVSLLFPIVGLSLAAGPTRPLPPDSVVLHRYAATERSWHVNAWWLESPQGLVLIDALFLKPDAELLVAMMRATGKPLAGIIITHPHVDHFGGIRTILRAFPDAPVFATPATAAAMPRTEERSYREGWIQAYGADYERGAFVPDRQVASGTSLTLAGMHFTITDIGAMEAENNSVVFNQELNALFTGDATVAGGQFFTGEGRSARSLTALERLGRDFSAVSQVYSGHYEPARIAPLIAADLTQIRYLRAVMRRALGERANLAADGSLTPAARRALAAEVAEHLAATGDYGLGPITLSGMNLGGIEQEMRDGRPEN